MIRASLPGFLLILILAASLTNRARAAEDDSAAAWRRWVEREFLLGRIEQTFVDQALWDAKDPVALWPLALRDLWWRPSPDEDRRRHYEQVADRSPLVLVPPYRWLLGGGAGPFPAPETSADPWPVLTALILDRQRREVRGRHGLPAESPLRALPVEPTEHADWWLWWRASFLDDVMQTAYVDPDARIRSPEVIEASRALDDRARSGRTRNLILAATTLLVFLGLVIGLGRRAQPHKTT